MKMEELISTVLVICTFIIVIFEGFLFFVHNPAAVVVGQDIIKDGHVVSATQWDATYSYIFPIYWTLGTALVVIIIICIIDAIWNGIINRINI